MGAQIKLEQGEATATMEVSHLWPDLDFGTYIEIDFYSNSFACDALRFNIGDRVQCNTSDGWSDGTVVDWYYQETDWLPENVAPYQVELDKEKRLIFAPSDDNRVIRKTDAED